MTDIVREVIERAKKRIAEGYGLPDEVADLLSRVEAEIKAEYKGESLHVRSPADRPSTRANPDAVARDYLNNVPIEDIESRHGISRATIYRYLKRR